MSFFRPAAVLGLLVLAAPRAAADAPATVIEVDARDLPRRLIHTTLDIPCKPGPLRLWYPKWLPGAHGPYGRVEDVAGLRVEAPDGRVIPWERDEVNLHCFTVRAPAGATAVRVKLDTVCEAAGTGRAGVYSYGNTALGVINWNTCVVYPEGPTADQQPVKVRLRLPAGWRYATALKPDGAAGGAVAFRPVSLTALLDNPLIAGRHLRTIKLDAGDTPPAFLHLTSESPEALNLDAKVVGQYSRLVREAGALFGAAHYPEYHFLVVCSDDLGRFGLEHSWCSLNGVGERGLIDDRARKGWLANLLPHEYAHSWCGKYRRPAAMITPDFHTHQKTKLLWVYEGLTEYLGEVLMVRSGLVTPDEYRVTLTGHIRALSRTTGRQWRPLADTAVASHLSRNPGASWNGLRRSQDYYMEGMLLWYECDAIIRERTDGARSLDDFCKRFFAAVPGRKAVAGYEFADVVRELGATAEYDWDGFLRRRVTAPQESLPLDVVGRLGYRLKYADKPPAAGPRVTAPPADNPAADSLGVVIVNGRVRSVDPGLPADKAGLAPGLRVIGVNGKRYSTNRLRDAIADSVTRKKVEFLLEDGDEFRTVVVPYADGLRYLELARADGRPDVLGAILKPRAK
jgi:predicted metalloprotease with PDZ domain